MMSEIKEIQRKISVLKLAESLGNVSAACRQSGISRSQFYEYKKRFEAEGSDGLRNHPPLAKYHPNKTPQEVADKIIMLALQYPGRGPNYLESILASDGIRVSFVTIQKILERKGLGSRHDRQIELEKKWVEDAIVLNPGQVAFMELRNPEFRERHCMSSRPGETLCQAAFLMGSCAGIGRIYLHAVVDAYCSYAFGILHSSKSPEAAVSLLHQTVFPFYRRRHLNISRIITTGPSGLFGDVDKTYGHYLNLNGIGWNNNAGVEHVNGFVERFRRTAAKDFFKLRLYDPVACDTVAEVQHEFDQWLHAYNRSPHEGYRNNGKTPWGQITGYRS
ncbi:helix-turn-helix domain-containing protein [Chlorobium limicola]